MPRKSLTVVADRPPRLHHFRVPACHILLPLTLLPLTDSCRRHLNKSTRRALVNGRAPQSAIQQIFLAAVQRTQNAPLVQQPAQQPVAAVSQRASVAHPSSLAQNTAFAQPPAPQSVAAISATTRQQTSVTPASPDHIIPDYIDTTLSPMRLPEAERDFDTWTDDGMWDIQVAPPEQEKHDTPPKKEKHDTSPEDDDCPGSKGTPSKATPPRHSSDDGTSHIGSRHPSFEDHSPSGSKATPSRATPPLHPSEDGILHINSSPPGVSSLQEEKRQGPPER
jgi:hypothetical protein